MSVYIKQSGAWVQQAGRPTLKRPGQGWVGVQEGWVKRSGVWTRFYVYDATPPVAPTLAVSEVDTTYQIGTALTGTGGWGGLAAQYGHGRYIKLTVTPGAVDATVRRIRVLVSDSVQPPSQYDPSTYYSGEDGPNSLPGEPWSDIWFNGFNDSPRTTSSSVFRFWTRSAADQTYVKAGTYYFSAWAEDFNGNWSPAAHTSITLARATTVNTQSYTDTFDANNAGTWYNSAFHAGDQTQATNPRRRGVYLYGDKIANRLNQTGTRHQVSNAQIFLHRRDDSGDPTANVYLFWHPWKTTGDLPSDGTFPMSDPQKIGTISKGEAKWFSIPQSYWSHIENSTLKGFGLNNKPLDPASATDKDFTVMKNITDAPRSGEVRISWTEVP